MESKLIFLDIDGTLTLPGAEEVPASALQAVRGAQKKGHRVFLCTGRNCGMIRPLLKYGFDGVIGSSGGYIECEGKVIYDCPIEEEKRRLAMDVLQKNGIYRTIECKDGSYTDESFKEFLRQNAGKENNSELLRWREQLEQSLNIRPMGEYEGQPAYKLVIVSEKMEQLEEARRVLEQDFKFCIQDADASGFINGEMINRAFDKGQAVKRVCDHYGISLEHTVGFGDSMNDWEMLKVVNLGICMANGSEQLKKLADDICPSVEEDGIYQAFCKHHLME